MSTNPRTLPSATGTDRSATMRSPRESGAISLRHRAQPSLLDRLTDEAPEQREEPQGQHLLSAGALRKTVLRDLGWLFNSVNANSTFDLAPYPHVARSTLNYGLDALSGKHLSEIDWKHVEKMLTVAIRNYEPRIAPGDLVVRCLPRNDGQDRHHVLSIEIRGELRHSPSPLPFLFRTDIDLESGHFDCVDMG
ncbi:type VI secretion system baseplate subunit TssE [Paraburkholderia lycopersici]|uniref:Type VI secretion system protein ImpF n=1 Tax=Paraburkholderia lycopersici TaxID=416944 RepID=A0A1G6XSR9_9BURK|nr:type VI secretion system baseplate subunit TssE [Paraburkholderia lycopersici]SDD81239.1 type VI secretion system protein ImpF [Paraburkholderia lycopersici]